MMGSAPSSTPTPGALLFEACPFLDSYRTESWGCGDTIVFGDVARLLQQNRFPADQREAVFGFFNSLAETGNEQALDVLATGALETFNDDAAGQSMARRRLRGNALQLLEKMRLSWGQPDYGTEASS